MSCPREAPTPSRPGSPRGPRPGTTNGALPWRLSRNWASSHSRAVSIVRYIATRSSAREAERFVPTASGRRLCRHACLLLQGRTSGAVPEPTSGPIGAWSVILAPVHFGPGPPFGPWWTAPWGTRSRVGPVGWEAMATATPSIIDVTDETFGTAVLEESMRRPVVVDFWADWCQPCKVIGPVLERLADEKQGAFLLAKLDVEANRQTAGTFGIMSIPAVKAFRKRPPGRGVRRRRSRSPRSASSSTSSSPPRPTGRRRGRGGRDRGPPGRRRARVPRGARARSEEPPGVAGAGAGSPPAGATSTARDRS